MGDRVAIVVNGRRFQGWNSARVTRGLEQLCGTFTLSVTDRWDDGDPWPVREGDACEVIVNDQTLITGWVFSREQDVDGGSHTITVEGRDRAADLVDCSAQLDRWEFSNVDVLALAQKLCKPFGVSVTLQAGLALSSISIPKKHSIDPGDTVQASLENLCKVAGLLPISDGAGGVVLVRSGTGRCSGALVLGQNLKRLGARYDYSSRFARYEVMGSHKGRDDLSGAAAAGVKGAATDSAIRAARVLVVRPDGNVTTTTARQRAQWEAAMRAARSETVTGTVQGWTQPDGSLWPLNAVVPVEAPRAGIQGDMLIAGLTFALDLSGGTTTELTLKDPAAYRPDPTLGAPPGNNYWKEIVRGV